ncbi:MFS transporter [Aldersonia sp. NBC_00410]|uniref:MDR family MFS transporter n=1 Tax=Aldersonia sp. NBC_00410 TaxID=2975954 RepID=UPI002258880C|nr:MDR family MFS transporter [Aldersonia sp. NBC_00410]MCX5043208.1 MFS transporter [Aldersonia sp. NBC_00410]
MSGLMLGMLLAALDQTIVSTAIRTIADDLNGYALQVWVTTAYLITATLATPLYGKLSDMYGRKPFYLAAISIFLVGSLLCTTAQSMYELAAFRAFQGLGAGGLLSLALTIMGDIVSPRERARYQGYFIAVFGTSSVLGPVLGGLFAGQETILGISGWRWVFLVNVPIGLIALIVVSRVLHLPRREHGSLRVDYWGVAALAIGIVPLLVVAEQGRIWGWDAPRSWACYVIGTIGVAAFIAIEAWMKEDALIPLRIFRNRTFALGIVISVVIGAGMFGGITLIPQYLQVVRGASPTLAGLAMLPLVLGMMLGSILSGQLISRTGRYRIFPLAGLALASIGMFLLHLVSADTPLPVAMVFMLISGLGLGNTMAPLMLALQNALPARDMGLSTGAATFFRQIGGTLGIAVFLSILFAQLAPSIAGELQASAQNPEFTQAIAAANQPGADPVDQMLAGGLANHDPAVAEHVLTDSSIVQQLSPALARPFQVGFANAMSTVFLCVSLVVAFGFVLVLFWKEIPLRTSAVPEKAAAAAGPEPLA